MDERAISNPNAGLATPQTQPPMAKRMRDIFGRDWKMGYLFVLPMALFMLGLIFWPFVSAIMLSTTTLKFQTGDLVNVGLKNYQRLFTNSDYLLSMKNTISFTFWSLSVK